MYSLSYTAVFIDEVWAEFAQGVKVERNPLDVKRVFQQVNKINMEAPTIWKNEYNKLFEAKYPYIRQLSESYRLPLGDLMNLQPEGSTSHPNMTSTQASGTAAIPNPGAETERHKP